MIDLRRCCGTNENHNRMFRRKTFALLNLSEHQWYILYSMSRHFRPNSIHRSSLKLENIKIYLHNTLRWGNHFEMKTFFGFPCKSVCSNFQITPTDNFENTFKNASFACAGNVVDGSTLPIEKYITPSCDWFMNFSTSCKKRIQIKAFYITNFLITIFKNKIRLLYEAFRTRVSVIICHK